MFYRENLERHLERKRMTELRAVCKVIYGVILTVITRRRFLRIKVQIILVQKMVKVCTYTQCSINDFVMYVVMQHKAYVLL